MRADAVIGRRMRRKGPEDFAGPRMEELVELLERWDPHPERTVTDRFPFDDAVAAYATADAALGGKVALLPGQ